MDPMSCRFEMKEFDGKRDFGLWKYKLLGQLEILGLLSVLEELEDTESEETGSGTSAQKKPETDIEKKPAVDKKKRAEIDRRVKSLLGTCLSDNILRKIMHETTSLGMWKALEREYQHKSLPNRIYLKKKISCYKMDEDKSIEENVDMFLKLIADLASLKVTISDEDQAIQILSGLPPLYDPLVHTLQYGSGKETLTMSDVVTAAYSKEAELRSKGLLGKKGQSSSLIVETRGRSETRGHQNGNGNRGKSKNRSKSRGKDQKSKTACFVCGKEGHWKRDCWSKGKKK